METGGIPKIKKRMCAVSMNIYGNVVEGMRIKYITVVKG